MQLERWIAQFVSNKQGWPNRANDHPLRLGAENNEPAYENVIRGLHQTARRDIRQFGISRSIQVINLKKRDAGRVTHSAHDRILATRRQRRLGQREKALS